MVTFNIKAQVTVNAYTTVEADTPDQAIQKLSHRAVVFDDGSESAPSVSWVVDSMDGLVDNIKIDGEGQMSGPKSTLSNLQFANYAALIASDAAQWSAECILSTTAPMNHDELSKFNTRMKYYLDSINS